MPGCTSSAFAASTGTPGAPGRNGCLGWSPSPVAPSSQQDRHSPSSPRSSSSSPRASASSSSESSGLPGSSGSTAGASWRNQSDSAPAPSTARSSSAVVSTRERRHRGSRAEFTSQPRPGRTNRRTASGVRAATTRNDGDTDAPKPSTTAVRCSERPGTAPVVPPNAPYSGSRTSLSTRSTASPRPCTSASTITRGSL